MREKTAKYIRVSSVNQNTARQKIDDIKIYEDKCSGAIEFEKRPSALKLMTDIGKGKITTLHIHSIDRLGRNQIDVLNTIQKLKNYKCQLVIDGLNLEMYMSSGKQNPAFGMLVSILSQQAEAELELIKERQNEGILATKLADKKLKEAGVKVGVKYAGRKAETKESKEKFIDKYKSMTNGADLMSDIQSSTIPNAKISRLYGISINTVKKLKQAIEGI